MYQSGLHNKQCEDKDNDLHADEGDTGAPRVGNEDDREDDDYCEDEHYGYHDCYVYEHRGIQGIPYANALLQLC